MAARRAGCRTCRYGNGRSWIADRVAGAWVQIELPQVRRIRKVIWGRDREGNFIDRLATQYDIEVATDTNAWRIVASSAGREPLSTGAELILSGSITRSLVNRFAPVSTTFSAEASPGSGEYRIDATHDWIQVRTGHRTKGQDDRHQGGAGGDRVF